MRINPDFGVILAALLMLMVHPAFGDTTLVYDYDANGNLIRGAGKYFEYNDANKLVRVRHGDAAGPVIAEYVYDYSGQRVKKIENGITTYYVGKHFEKQVGGEQPGYASYYFANGQRVARKNAAGGVVYYHADHLGGTNVITDSTGDIVERTRYYPFGDIREGGSDRYTYTGKEKDNATDFYYFEARHYQAGYRHFTQPDVIEPDAYAPQSLNRYAYVENNPMKFVDITGLFAVPNWKLFKAQKDSIKKSISTVKSSAIRQSEKTIGGVKKWSEKQIAYGKEGMKEFIKPGLVNKHGLGTLVPRYGEYGGPNWTGGVWGGNDFDKNHFDKMDEYFKGHDENYRLGEKAKIEGDFILSYQLISMKKDESPESIYGKIYRNAAILWFPVQGLGRITKYEWEKQAKKKNLPYRRLIKN